MWRLQERGRTAQIIRVDTIVHPLASMLLQRRRLQPLLPTRATRARALWPSIRVATAMLTHRKTRFPLASHRIRGRDLSICPRRWWESTPPDQLRAMRPMAICSPVKDSTVELKKQLSCSTSNPEAGRTMHLARVHLHRDRMPTASHKMRSTLGQWKLCFRHNQRSFLPSIRKTLTNRRQCCLLHL